jgi:hypothetical protein
MAGAGKRRQIVAPVIADAGPLIALAKVDRLALLRGLFGRVQLTPEVLAELSLEDGRADAQPLQAALRAGWLAQATVQTAPAPHPFLDAGESSCLALAGTQARALLIIDEKLGRREAKRMNIAITGTAGILIAAKARALIDAVVPLLEEMREAGYFLGDKVIEDAREQARE